MEYPNCRNWQAQESQNTWGAGLWTLTVTGEVEISPSDPAYTLYVRDAEGDRIRLQLGYILLAGEVAPENPGSGPVTCWTKVGFQQTDLPGPTYNNLMVLYDDFVVGTGAVEVIHSAASDQAPSAQAGDGASDSSID